MLLGKPRYRGYRFGKQAPRPQYEAARRKVTPAEKPAGAQESGAQPHVVYRSRPASSTRRATYRDVDDDPWVTSLGASRSRRRRSGPIFIPSGGSSSSDGGLLSGLFGGGSSSGGSRGGASSGGSRSSSSEGSRGGAAAAGAAGIGAAIKWGLIIIAVAAAALFTVFVLIPAIMLAVEFAIIGVIVAWHEVTKRPWVVEARQEETALPEVHAWEVVGLKRSREIIDDLAEDLRRGEEPQPDDAELVRVTEPDG